MTRNIPISFDLYQKLQSLSGQYHRPVDELLENAIEIQYGETAVAARQRLMDRLARLEASLGDRERLETEVIRESRLVRGATPLKRTSLGDHGPTKA